MSHTTESDFEVDLDDHESFDSQGSSIEDDESVRKDNDDSNDDSDDAKDEDSDLSTVCGKQKAPVLKTQVQKQSDRDDSDWESRIPSKQEREAIREQNVRALMDGSLAVARKPMLPKLLTVQDAEVVLRKPFKSPHPDAPARSESLKRALAARKQFVPWGGGRPFQPPVKLQPAPQDPPPSHGDLAPASNPITLPPGIDPLILWTPPPEAGGQPVKVDDALTRFLRPHQREGVQFMFECVTGLRGFQGNGCILADDMGLGKTLQGITLLWTLLNTGHEVLGGVPLAKRVIICCPTSLVANWDSECTKWLNGRVRTLPLCESSREEVISTIDQFLSPRAPPQLLIVSYETFRLHAERFKAPEACDLLICDEAHRLKNDQTLTNRALDSLACKRRVLLSGTPMQNQLQEFYAMVNFANPGVLGSPSDFRKRFEAPILAGREPDATDDQSALGAERSSELSKIVNEFILRRTNTLLSAHLPPKVVEMVCCRMTPLQYSLYVHFLQSRSVRTLFATQKSARALSAIISLRKLLNHPKLIYDMIHGGDSATKNFSGRVSLQRTEGKSDGFEGASALFPPGLFDPPSHRTGRQHGQCTILPHGWEELSGKFAVVSRMLALLREQTRDRVVIVSNFTQTLELFTILCRERGYPYLRLDGSTTIKQRQKLVKRFNDPSEDQFVFLLSSKAGGCGLNLVGGNRLILFDMSWNPADDKQAAARVWRDGQRRKVYVYRLMTTGTIEEKVYQRQLSKEGLQTVVDSGGGSDSGNKGGGGGNGKSSNGEAPMSLEELRDLFSYDPDTLSSTYDHIVAESGARRKRKRPRETEENRLTLSQQRDEDTEVEAEMEKPDKESSVNLKSAALAAAQGEILKEQSGAPKEEDLEAWGHHSNPQTVPDDLMRLVGSPDVTFVFSCKVEGRDVPPDPPLVPLGLGSKPPLASRHIQGTQTVGPWDKTAKTGVAPSVKGPPISAPPRAIAMPPPSARPPSVATTAKATGNNKENRDVPLLLHNKGKEYPRTGSMPSTRPQESITPSPGPRSHPILGMKKLNSVTPYGKHTTSSGRKLKIREDQTGDSDDDFK